MTRAGGSALALWLLALVVAGGWLLAKTSVVTDLTAFLPQARSPSERLLLGELRNGPASRLILIALEGGSPQALAAASKALAEGLRGRESFVRVTNGAQLLSARDRELLFAHRYLLSPAVDAQQFSAAALEAALRERLRELASPLGGMDKQALAADPTAAFRALLASWREPQAPGSRHGVWFDRDGRRALLLAETAASGYDLDAQAQALATIRKAFAVVDTGADTRLLLAGPGLYAVASRDVTRRETQLLSAAASVAVALILLAAYRSGRVLVLGALPLASGLLLASAAVSLWFGSIHGLTLAFGTTLLGIAIDYPIHLFSHLRGGHATASALARIWPTLRLGVVTTALGFGALLGAGFSGLAQLGLFAVCGLLSAAAVTRWVLPALLPAQGLFGSSGSEPVLRRLEWLQGRLGPLPALGIALGLAVLLAPGAFPWEDDLAAMSPVPDSVRQLDGELRRALGAPEVSHAVVITAADPQQALRRTEAVADQLQELVAGRVLTGFSAASRFLPSAARQERRRQALPGASELAANLAQARTGLPFRADAFAPFLADVAAARQQAPLRPADLADSTVGARLASLLFAHDQGWTSVIPLSGVGDPQALEQWAQRAGPGVHYLDQRAVARELMTRFRSEGLSRASWSALIIVTVLALALRSGSRLVRVLLPLLLATLLDLALLTALGARISLFHLVALLMVLGAGVDYSLFFNRPAADARERRQTLHALLVCATSTVAVFGILAWSEIPVLRAIGSTVAIGVSASLLFAMLMAKPVPDTAR